MVNLNLPCHSKKFTILSELWSLLSYLSVEVSIDIIHVLNVCFE